MKNGPTHGATIVRNGASMRAVNGPMHQTTICKSSYFARFATIDAVT